MNRQFEKRINELERQYVPSKKNLMLVMKDEEETTEEAFKRLGKPGKIEDYNKRILRIVPVSVKRTGNE